MNVTDPILRVSVVSTGQVQIRPDHEASTWRPAAWWLLASRHWTGPRPINAYVIEHRDGLVLFDTGQDRASVTDPGYFPGGMTGVLYGRLARFEISPDQTLSAGLNRLGYAAGDVTTAVLSHLHQDHIGGLAELDHADILLSVFLHGLSSVPLVAAYSRWYAAHVAKNPSASEAKPTIMSRLRHRPAPEETEPEKPEPGKPEPVTAQ